MVRPRADIPGRNRVAIFGADARRPRLAEAPAPVRTFTRAEKIGKVADWILAGLRLSQLAEEWNRAGWGEITHHEVMEITTAAHEIIEADARIDPARETAKAIGRLNDLYARALEIQDFKTALRIQKQLDSTLAKASAARALADDDQAEEQE